MASALRALAAVGAVALALTIGAGDAWAQVCAEGGGGGTSLICPGDNATADGLFSTAVGQTATTGTAANATATGFGASASGGLSTATGSNADASDVFSTATGTFARASGFSSVATGHAAIASGEFSTATGPLAVASGQDSTATGFFAGASGAHSTATGSLARALADGSTALGAGSQATFDNSTAIGLGATTERANQIVLGTPTETYTLPGLPGGVSRSFQSGPLGLVTTDAMGNLASDGGSTFDSIEENTEGVAIALALENPDLKGAEQFGLAVNGGFFEGQNAIAVSAMATIIDDISMSGTDRGARLAFSGGGSYGFEHGQFGGRAGLQLTW